MSSDDIYLEEPPFGSDTSMSGGGQEKESDTGLLKSDGGEEDASSAGDNLEEAASDSDSTVATADLVAILNGGKPAETTGKISVPDVVTVVGGSNADATGVDNGKDVEEGVAVAASTEGSRPAKKQKATAPLTRTKYTEKNCPFDISLLVPHDIENVTTEVYVPKTEDKLPITVGLECSVAQSIMVEGNEYVLDDFKAELLRRIGIALKIAPSNAYSKLRVRLMCSSAVFSTLG